jgi:hypothetical protein
MLILLTTYLVFVSVFYTCFVYNCVNVPMYICISKYCNNLYLLCSAVVNYFLPSRYCILLIGVCMLLFVVL